MEFTKSVPDALRGNVGHRIVSILSDRLLDLRDSWNYSTARILANEIGNFPRRIFAILRRPSLASLGVPLPDDLLGHDLESSCLLNSFWPACTEGIRRQRKRSPWMGPLDIEMFGEAFQSGAKWGRNNSCREQHSVESLPFRTSPPSASCTATVSSSSGPVVASGVSQGGHR